MKNHYFKKIQFNRDFRCFKAKDTIEFKAGINLIVGEQGCGKSSLFYSIINWNESGISADFDANSSYLFLDTESMNPRLDDSFKAHRDFEDVKSYQKAEFSSAAERLTQGYKEQSHGQVMLPLLLANKDVKGKTLFFDEPEAGLSIRSQYKVMEHFRNLSVHNQLVIATHSPIFMEEVGEVYSLEHRKVMPSWTFIDWQKGKIEL